MLRGLVARRHSECARLGSRGLKKLRLHGNIRETVDHENHTGELPRSPCDETRGREAVDGLADDPSGVAVAQLTARDEVENALRVGAYLFELLFT